MSVTPGLEKSEFSWYLLAGAGGGARFSRSDLQSNK